MGSVEARVLTSLHRVSVGRGRRANAALAADLLPAAAPTLETVTSEPRSILGLVADVVAAAFHGVLGARPPYATTSGVEALVGCHALNCYR
jgi:hypothetical protein